MKKRQSNEDIVKRYHEDKIQVVNIGGFPSIYYREIPELTLSLGNGNVMYYYFYIPSLDILCRYISY